MGPFDRRNLLHGSLSISHLHISVCVILIYVSVDTNFEDQLEVDIRQIYVDIRHGDVDTRHGDVSTQHLRHGNLGTRQVPSSRPVLCNECEIQT